MTRNVRCTALESACVQITLQACQRGLHEGPSTQASAAGDGFRPHRTQPAPAVFPSSPTPWQMLDNIDVNTVYQTRFNVLQNCPVHLKGRFRQASRTAFDACHQAAFGEDATQEIRAWKLFCVLPFWLLRRPHGGGHVGKAELNKRFDDFAAGLWTQLHRNAELDTPSPNRKHTTMTMEQKGRAADQRVRMGEVSRARQCLTGAAVAPGNDTTFQDMQRKRQQIPVVPLPQEVLNFQPQVPVQFDRKTFLASLKSAPRGSSPGPGGWTYEYLKGLLDDTDTFEWLLSACNSLSQAKVPRKIAEVLMSARMTALTKPNGGVRGIAIGGSLRHLVARTLAKQFSKVFETECAPFQYALSTRAGTDFVGHMLRASTDAEPTATGQTLAHARCQGTSPVREVVLRLTFTIFVGAMEKE